MVIVDDRRPGRHKTIFKRNAKALSLSAIVNVRFRRRHKMLFVYFSERKLQARLCVAVAKLSKAAKALQVLLCMLRPMYMFARETRVPSLATAHTGYGPTQPTMSI